MLSNIHTPTLLLDEARCRSNIARMAEKAARHGVHLRPHVKTHQSPALSIWLKDYGVDRLTVTSLEMAEAFANAGWNDLLIAFPFNVRQTDRASALAARIRLSIFVNDPDVAELLEKTLKLPVQVMIEVDTGYGRSGIWWEDIEAMERLVKRFRHSKNLRFKGFYAHSGHTYQAPTEEEILFMHEETLQRMHYVRQCVNTYDEPVTVVVGDTPACSLAENFAGAQEMTCGNFIFYDLFQYNLGSCAIDQIAVVMACPVVEVHRNRLEAVLHGGAVHFSKDGLRGAEGDTNFGQMITMKPDGTGWGKPLPGCFLRALSQEHGMLRLTPEAMENIRPGDLVGIVPVHACLTTDLMRNFLVVNGPHAGAIIPAYDRHRLPLAEVVVS